MTLTATKHKLAYILNVYPHGQTNIVNELKALENNGIDVHIVAVKHPDGSHHVRVHHETPYPVTYLLEQPDNNVCGRRLLKDHLCCVMKHPLSYFSQAMISMRWFGSNFKLAGCFVKAFESIQPTLVYVNWSWATCGSVMYACRILHLPFVFSVLGTDITPPAQNFSLRVDTAQRILTPSKGYAEILQNELHVPSSKIRIVPYYLESKAFERVKPARDKIVGPLRLLNIATLRPVKRHKDLIRACAILRQQGIDFECRIFGEGPDRERLEVQISELGLTENVILAGHVLQDKLPEQFEWCDIYVHASERESFCFAVIEAQASARPIVVVDSTGGIRQSTRPGVTAVTVPARNPEALAEAIMKVARAPCLRQQMGYAGRDFVTKNFSYEHFAPIFLKALFD